MKRYNTYPSYLSSNPISYAITKSLRLSKVIIRTERVSFLKLS